MRNESERKVVGGGEERHEEGAICKILGASNVLLYDWKLEGPREDSEAPSAVGALELGNAHRGGPASEYCDFRISTEASALKP